MFKKIYYSFKTAPFLHVILVFLSLFLGSFNVWLSYLINQQIDNFLYKDGQNAGVISMILLVSCICFGFFIYWKIVFSEKLFLKVTKSLRKQILKDILYSNDQKHIPTGSEFLLYYIDDVDALGNFILHIVFPGIQFLWNIIFGFIYIFSQTSQIGWLVFIFTIVVFYINYTTSFKAIKYRTELKKEEEKRNLFINEFYDNFSILKVYNGNEYMQHKTTNYNKNIFTPLHLLTRQTSIATSFSNNLELMVAFLVVVLGILLMNKGFLTAGALIGVWNASTGSIIYPASELPSIFHAWIHFKSAENRLENLLDSKSSSNMDKKDRTDAILQRDNLEYLVFSSVTSAYEKKQIFQDFSATFEKGKINYIVGDSGVGKTTLFSLILNRLHISTGKIYVESEEGKQISNIDAQIFIGYVPQHHAIFSLTIADNIRMGNEKIDDERIKEICHLLDMDTSIQSLPKAYNSIIYKDFHPSLGQEQRISIARAIAADKDILLFDEPYASLDIKNKKRLHKQIDQLAKKKICIVINHDLEMLNENEDNILVLKGEMLK